MGLFSRDRVKSWIFRLGAKRTLHGIVVSYFYPDRKIQEQGFTKLEAALDLLAQVSPARHTRVVRCVPRILIFGELATVGSWHQRLQLCELFEEHFRASGTSIAEVASILLHEATHAYFHRKGLPYDESARWRIEQLCLRTERAFARRLPAEDGAPIMEAIEEILTLEPAYYTDVGHLERQLQAVKDSDVPNWTKRFMERLARRAIRRRQERLGQGASD